jgi:hypothetical protein
VCAPGRVYDVCHRLVHQSPQAQVELLDVIRIRPGPVFAPAQVVQVVRCVDGVLQLLSGIRQSREPWVRLSN